MKPLRTMSIVAFVCFGASVLLNVVEIPQDLALIDFVEGVLRGEPVDEARAEQIESSASAVGIALGVASVGSFAALITWLYRAHSNLRRAKLPRLKYGSGWAIGGFFVPILNLARPYQVMCEVWRGTACVAGRTQVSFWQRARVSPLVGWWWGLLLVHTAGARLTARMFLRLRTVESLIGASWVSIGTSVLSIAASLLAVYLVYTISRQQDEAAAATDEPA